MKKISHIIILSAFILFAANGQVRQPHQLYFMDGIPQIVQMNPALQPKANGYVFFPGFNANVDLYLGLTLKDAFQQQNNNVYTPFEKEYDYKKLNRSLGRKATMFNGGADLDILGFGWRTNNGYFSFGLSYHGFINAALPSDLLKILDDPMPNKIDFSPLGVRGMAYAQFRFGYSREITEKLTVGVSVKPIIGNIGATTRLSDFELRTGRDQWTLSGNGGFYLSAPIKIIQDSEGNFDVDDSLMDDFKDMKAMDIGRSFINPGIAFDFGASYKIDDRLTVSASLNNLGFISWNKNASIVTFPGGSFSFDGVEIDISKDEDIGKQMEGQFGNLFDDIMDGLDGTVNHDGFSTFLPTVVHLGATYQLTRRSTAGLLSRTVFYPSGSVRQSFNLSYYTPVIGNFLLFNTGLTYQINSTVYSNLGLIFNFGPLQFYTLFDYIPLHWARTTIDGEPLFDMDFPLPSHLNSFTARLGLNFTFGRHGFRNNPMLNKGKSSWN